MGPRKGDRGLVPFARQDRLYSGHIFRCIHLERPVRDRRDGDRVAVLERSQLLQAFF